MQNKRNLNIEALRVYMMLLIVILHISGSYLDADIVRQSSGCEMGWLLGYRSLTFLGVSTFAFISGFYGVKFHIDKFFTLEFMALTYGLLVLFALFFSKEIHLYTVRSLLFPIASNHLWYFSGYMILMCISPLLNEGIKNLSKESFKSTLCVLMIVIYGARFICGGANADFFNLLLVYLIGRFLKQYPSVFLISNRYMIFWSCIVVNFLISFSLGYYGLGKVNMLFEGNNNPVTALGAISLFYIFKMFPKTLCINKIVSILAPNMLAVYVLHELARTEGLIDFSILQGNLLLIFPIACATILILALFDKFRTFLFRPLINKINIFKL